MIRRARPGAGSRHAIVNRADDYSPHHPCSWLLARRVGVATRSPRLCAARRPRRHRADAARARNRSTPTDRRSRSRTTSTRSVDGRARPRRIAGRAGRCTAPRGSPATPRAIAIPEHDRGDGLRRHGPRSGGTRCRLRRRREAHGLDRTSRRRRTSTVSARSRRRRSVERAVPVPGGVMRDAVELTNDARRDIPSTLDLHGLHGRAVPDLCEGASP